MNSYKQPIGSLETAFKILEIICTEREFNSRLIAEKMNCDIRTARRYIEKIRYLFEDLIEVKPGYRYVWKGIPKIDKKILKSSNLQLLFALIEIGKKIGSDKDFWKTFESSLSKKIYNDDTINILFGSVLKYEEIEDKKVKIEKAIAKDKCIKFKYKKYNRYYEVEPLKIILWEGFWYLVGSDKKDEKFKTFAIDFMDKIEIIEDSSFEKTKKLKQLEGQLKSAESILQITENEPIEIKVLLFSEVANFFERRDILHEQKILEKYDNGDILVSFKIIGEGDLKIQLFKWIPFFKIIEPEKYKKIFIDILQEGLDIHKS